MNELENIDDECEEKDIDFVKTSDDDVQKEYDLPSLPALAFYRHKFRTIYSGEFQTIDRLNYITKGTCTNIILFGNSR